MELDDKRPERAAPEPVVQETTCTDSCAETQAAEEAARRKSIARSSARPRKRRTPRCSSAPREEALELRNARAHRFAQRVHRRTCCAGRRSDPSLAVDPKQCRVQCSAVRLSRMRGVIELLPSIYSKYGSHLIRFCGVTMYTLNNSRVLSHKHFLLCVFNNLEVYVHLHCTY